MTKCASPLRWLALLASPLAAGCETGPEVYSAVENVRYAAIGQEPFWMVSIGDDRIVLTTGQPDGAAPAEAVFARTLPRTVDGVRTWQSGDGTAVISIEAVPTPCQGSGGRVYEDQVRVRLSGVELNGCGGRVIDAGSAEGNTP